MGVPNTTTFELQDVVDTVNPTTDDLVDCFADAIASLFDSSYEGSKNQLLNFRNYGNLTSFNGSVGAKDPCSSSTTRLYYHNGSSSLPVVNDFVYDGSSGSTVLPSGNYKLSDGTKMEVSGGGVSTAGKVLVIGPC